MNTLTKKQETQIIIKLNNIFQQQMNGWNKTKNEKYLQNSQEAINLLSDMGINTYEKQMSIYAARD